MQMLVKSLEVFFFTNKISLQLETLTPSLIVKDLASFHNN